MRATDKIMRCSYVVFIQGRLNECPPPLGHSGAHMLIQRSHRNAPAVSDTTIGSPDAPAEPAWIRDCAAAEVTFDVPDAASLPRIIAEICEGETICCETCGKVCPLWPMKEWADHQVTEHGDNMTIQIS